MPDNATWLIILWLFALGAAVGSFLNVVIYRLPNKLSLVHPPSHCPKCGTPIKWYDNVPVFGWIKLGGRCRQCHCWISARYPIVEAVTSLMFGLLAIVELPDMLPVYPSHVVLLGTLLCAALIEYDGNRPPFSLFVPALLISGGTLAYWPELRPTASDWWGLSATMVEAANALGALLLATVFALAVRGRKAIGFAMSLTCVAVALGWQPVCLLAAATVLLTAIGWGIRRAWPVFHTPSTAILATLTFVWMLGSAYLVMG